MCVHLGISARLPLTVSMRSPSQVMSPKRRAAFELDEQEAVLRRLIELYTARGVSPSIPQLAGNGRSQTHAIFAAAGSDGSTPWGNDLLRS